MAISNNGNGHSHVREGHSGDAGMVITHKLQNATEREIGAFLGVHPSHVYDVKRRGVSPTLRRAMTSAGWLEPTRVRLAADVTAAQRERLRELAAERGMTWTELCRALADGELKLAE